MRNLLRLKSRGSVESFITIIPQVFVFLVMFQLVFMQFQVITDTYISQGKISRSAIYGTGDNFIRKPLIGGGSILLLEKTTEVSKFIDISTPARKKVVAIAVDENDKN